MIKNPEKIITNNRVELEGTITSPFIFSHEVFGVSFYETKLAIQRLSKYIDIIPLLVSENTIDVQKDLSGRNVHITGKYRSFTQHENEKNHLILSVLVQEIYYVNVTEKKENQFYNYIYLDGFICKTPIFRTSPRGRKLTDIMMAVNRFRKTDYIPCLTWGYYALYASKLEVGTRIAIWGRIQSRPYEKKFDDKKSEARIAYEVSISKFSCIDCF